MLKLPLQFLKLTGYPLIFLRAEFIIVFELFIVLKVDDL